MSTYGNYLTEEDPNKKKQEGTTPSTTPTTAPGGTTTPPLAYEGFIGTGSGSQAYQAGVGVINSNHDTAVNTATTNRDLGYEYAEGVRNSIYGNAAAQRAEADKNTEAARQRGIIDSKSSYQKAVGAYGSNAETLAGRGLSGSGYGEYLTADAYATHRGQVQNINADALRANREAAYTEKQAQMAADSEYLKNLYGINTEYNNAINKAYTNLIDSASKGVSIDAIMQDGTWGDLTPEQQQAITAEAEKLTNQNATNDTITNIEDAINDGATLEDIQKMPGYDELDDNVKEEIGEQVTERDEEIEASVDYVVEEVNYNEISSIDDLNSFLNSYSDAKGNLLSKDMKERIVAKWKSNNADNDIKQIGEASFGVDGQFGLGGLMIDGVEITGKMIANDIKNGVYGDHAEQVIEAYGNRLVDAMKSSEATADTLGYCLKQLESLGDAAKTYVDKINKNVYVRAVAFPEAKKISNGVYGFSLAGATYSSAFASVDNYAVLDLLNSICKEPNNYVRIANKGYFRGESGGWIEFTRITNPSTSGTQR